MEGRERGTERKEEEGARPNRDNMRARTTPARLHNHERHENESKQRASLPRQDESRSVSRPHGRPGRSGNSLAFLGSRSYQLDGRPADQPASAVRLWEVFVPPSLPSLLRPIPSPIDVSGPSNPRTKRRPTTGSGYGMRLRRSKALSCTSSSIMNELHPAYYKLSLS